MLMGFRRLARQPLLDIRIFELPGLFLDWMGTSENIAQLNSSYDQVQKVAEGGTQDNI